MRLLLAALALFLAAPLLHAQGDLLEPEKAFRFSARMVDAAHAEARFQVAEGYYLYRDKIRFSATGAILGAPAIPPGKIKEDEFFGKVETLRGDFKVRIPVSYAGAPQAFTLKAMFQGCADIGVCYPPQDSSVKLEPYPVPAAKPAAGGAAQGGVLSGLRQLASELAGGGQDFLPPEQAFRLELSPGGADTLTARFTVARDYYLYRDKIRFRVTSPEGVQVAGVDLPRAEEKDDPAFGKTQVYHRSFEARVRLSGLKAGANAVGITASYQGCSEKGICYPPIDKPFELTLTSAGVAAAAAAPGTDARPPEAAPAPAEAAPVAVAPAAADAGDTSETGRVADILRGGNFWVVVASFFGAGLLLALTPCVFPMIPILSGIIVGAGHHVTKTRGFLLSLSYVLGMALTYALAGVAAGLSGTLLSAALQNPWALGTAAAIFVALAFSMFGFYELQLPSFLQSRLTETSNKVRGGHMGGVFVMGVISALIVGPCVAAPLAGALLYIGQTGDVVLGGASLFSMALGMGVPLLLIGVSAGALLPRAGAWMEAVKRFFGTLMLAVAIWLVAPLLPVVAEMLAWAALLIVAAVYLKALEPLPREAGGWHRLWKGVGVIALVAGVALLLGALGGSRDVLQPLTVFKGGAAGAAEAPRLEFRRVNDLAELDAAIRSAQGRPVMLDFYADWCVSCKELERFTFTDPRVQARLKDVLLLKADVTANSADDKALLKRFNLFGPPGIVFFDRSGQELAFRVIGYEPPEKFLASLDNVVAAAANAGEAGVKSAQADGQSHEAQK